MFSNIEPTKVLEPHEVFGLKYRNVNISDTLDKISKDFIVPYPPGIPLICPGEIITKEVINIIEEYTNNNLKVIGVENSCIKVI